MDCGTQEDFDKIHTTIECTVNAVGYMECSCSCRSMGDLAEEEFTGRREDNIWEDNMCFSDFGAKNVQNTRITVFIFFIIFCPF